jgi:hypothetical protein
MENKIQKLVKELSKNERIQTVMQEVHQLQTKLNDEMAKTLEMFKKSAGDIEKNIQTYKKQLLTQKDRLEKELRAKAKAMQGGSSRRTSSKKATSAKASGGATSTTKKKASKKKTTRKASSKKNA